MKSPERKQLLQILQARFDQNMPWHAGINWADVAARLEANPATLESLRAMESTGDEPDVIGRGPQSGPFTFCDCAPESPIGRRSTCYDGEARAARKENKPDHSAIEMAAAMGIDLLTEAQYRALQKARRLRLEDLQLDQNVTRGQGPWRRPVL